MLLPLATLVAVVWAVGSPAAGQSPPPSPCTSYYSYDRDSSGQFVGLIRFLTPPRYSQVRLATRLSSTVVEEEHEVGELALKGGLVAALEATRSVVAGRRHVLQYHLRFPRGKPLPALISININDREVCSAPDVNENSRATITLQAYLNTGVNTAPNVGGSEFGPPSNSIQPDPSEFSATNMPPVPPRPPDEGTPESWPSVIISPTRQPTTRPPTTRQPTTYQPPTYPTTSHQPAIKPIELPPPPSSIDNNGNEESAVDLQNCGVPTPKANQLVIFGWEAKKGQWPWQSAIFKKNVVIGFSVEFQCGGTLVSKRHIITASHCVIIKKEKLQLIATSDVLVSLGQYNIRNLAEEGLQLKEVQRIWSHPEYNVENYQNDIAIIELTSIVVFSDVVKPICLWDKGPDLKPWINATGTVGGWGKDETGSLSDKLKISNMPIVDEVTCLRSNTGFYTKFTSSNTFCAGYRNGTTLCNGDSGGGLHIQTSNPNQGGQNTWYLKGIISLSMTDLSEISNCDTKTYVIFTDVAKYMHWIKRYIK